MKQRRIYTPTMYCRGCDYVLDGLEFRHCPECGTRFDPEDASSFRITPKRHPKANPRNEAVTLLVALAILVGIFLWKPPAIFYVIVAGVTLPVALFVFILGRLATRWQTRLQVLRRGHDWAALRRHHAPLIPPSWYMRRGIAEYHRAYDLNRMGDSESALALLDRVEASKPHRCVIESIRALRITVLAECGRYDAAREAYRSLLEMPDVGPSSIAMGVAPEYCTGRFDRVMEICAEVLELDDGEDFARHMMAMSLMFQGAFAEALRAIDYEVSDAAKYYTEEELIFLRQSRHGAKMIEEIRRTYDAAVRPNRLLDAALLHLLMDDNEAAAACLESVAATEMIEEPIELSYEHLAAMLAADEGDAGRTADHLERAAALTRARSIGDERHTMHLIAGYCAYRLGRHAEAIEHVGAAERLARHPLAMHQTSYVLAKTLDAAGDVAGADAAWTRLASDGIDSYMAREARERSATDPPATP